MAGGRSVKTCELHRTVRAMDKAVVGMEWTARESIYQLRNSGEAYWSWYGFDSEVEWCACFVSWCAERCGYLDSGAVPKFSLCSDGVDWFNSRGQFEDGSYVPAVGDIIFFGWEEDGDVDHVGICDVLRTLSNNRGLIFRYLNIF